MEGLLTGFASAAFVLAACSLAASAVIFVKARVPDAVRFLWRKPVRPRMVPSADAPNSAVTSGQERISDTAVEVPIPVPPAASAPSDTPAHPEPPTRFLPDDLAPSDDESEDVHA